MKRGNRYRLPHPRADREMRKLLVRDAGSVVLEHRRSWGPREIGEAAMVGVRIPRSMLPAGVRKLGY